MGINTHKVATEMPDTYKPWKRFWFSLQFACFVLDTLYIYTFMINTVIIKKKLLEVRRPMVRVFM